MQRQFQTFSLNKYGQIHLQNHMDATAISFTQSKQNQMAATAASFTPNKQNHMVATAASFTIIFSKSNNSLVVARVQGITTALLGTELQRKERILAPRNVGIHMDLILRLREMSEPLASNGTQIHLRPGSQMDRPELTGAGRFGRADQFVRSAAEEIAARLVLQRPATAAILTDADLEAAARVPLLALAQHVAKLIDRKVLVQMRS